MPKFVVIDSPSKAFQAVVMATGHRLPQENLEDVIKDLQQRGVSGSVVFDLLASNGSRHSRFFEAGFDGRSFDSRPRYTPVDPEPCVRDATAQYIHAHLDDFDLSLLTPAMQFAAKRGVAL